MWSIGSSIKTHTESPRSNATNGASNGSWCTGSQPTGDLLSHPPVVGLPAEERHRTLTSTKLYCLVTEANRCEQLAQECYVAAPSENQTHDLMITMPLLSATP